MDTDMNQIVQLAVKIHIVLSGILSLVGFFGDPEVMAIFLNFLSSCGSLAWISYIDSGGGDDQVLALVTLVFGLNLLSAIVIFFRRRYRLKHGIPVSSVSYSDDEREDAGDQLMEDEEYDEDQQGGGSLTYSAPLLQADSTASEGLTLTRKLRTASPTTKRRKGRKQTS